MRFKCKEDSFSLGLHPKLKLNPNPNPSSFSPIFFLLSPLPKQPNRARKPAARKHREAKQGLFLSLFRYLGLGLILYCLDSRKAKWKEGVENGWALQQEVWLRVFSFAFCSTVKGRWDYLFIYNNRYREKDMGRV